ncbi:MAG: S8 family serine peptidase [Candidatus Riflebacteria bacterium]|nr:S8 family serine peptidase [Candidatus Riflebacteria bacterium]
MRSFGRFALVLTAVAFISSVSWGSDSVSNRWIVKFRAKSTISKVKFGKPSQIISYLQSELAENIEKTGNRDLFRNTSPLWISNAIAITSNPDEIKRISSMENVESVFPVEYRKWISDEPVTKKSIREVQWGVAKVRANEVWQKFSVDGSGVVVGHLDTGVDGKHPALAGKILKFKDFISSSTEPIDENGHGSHTAGTICGSEGVGVAPGARLVSARIFDNFGGGTEEGILKAMQWVMDPDENPETNDFPRLVSNSWGGDTPNKKLFYDAVQSWVALGMLPVFSAGNSGPKGKVGVPGAFPNTWAIGSTTDKDTLSRFSSIGPSTWEGVTYTKPDVTAPGSEIYSCDMNGKYSYKSGTSMACPHVSGLVAMMLQVNPALTISEIREIVESTVIDIGEKGKDIKFGSGRIDAFACIEKILPQTPVENVVQGYKMSLEIESWLNKDSRVSPLAGPMANYLIERIRLIDDSEFAVLKNLYFNDEAVSEVFKQINSARKFNSLQH